MELIIVDLRGLCVCYLRFNSTSDANPVSVVNVGLLVVRNVTGGSREGGGQSGHAAVQSVSPVRAPGL